MKRITALSFLALLACVIAFEGCAGTPGVKGLERVSSFEGGTLYRAGKIHVVQLSGTYREMGRQYGKLLSEQITKFREEVYKTILGLPDVPKQKIEEMADSLFSVYPERLKQVFYGMEETGGVKLDDLKKMDMAVILGWLSKQTVKHCTCIAAWGDYTGGAPLVFGRNFDFPSYFKTYDDTLSVVVYNPIDGSRSEATLCYAGQVSSLQAFNDAGLVIESNDASLSGSKELNFDRTSYQNNITDWLFDCDNLGALGTRISSNRLFHPIIFSIADKNSAVSYECDTDDYRKVPPTQNGFVVAVNHFVDPTWGIPEPQVPSTPPDPEEPAYMAWNSVQRYKNLTAMGDQYKGKWNVDIVKKALDTPVERGGAFKPFTIYQFIYTPASSKLLVRAVDYQDWIQVPLGEMFEKSVKKQTDNRELRSP